MPQPLRVVDQTREHPIEIARRAVKEFRLDRFKDPEKPLPVANVIDTGAPLLQVNEVIKRTEREMKEETRPRRSSARIQFAYGVMVLFILLASLGAMIIIAEALR